VTPHSTTKMKASIAGAMPRALIIGPIGGRSITTYWNDRWLLFNKALKVVAVNPSSARGSSFLEIQGRMQSPRLGSYLTSSAKGGSAEDSHCELFLLSQPIARVRAGFRVSASISRVAAP